MKRVLVIGNDAPDSFGYHIAMSYREIGYEVDVFVPHPRLFHVEGGLGMKTLKYRVAIHNILQKSQNYRKLYFSRLVQRVKEVDYSLILTTHDYFTHMEVKALRSLSDAPFVMWFPDPVQISSKFIGAAYSAIFLKEKFFVDKLTRHGVRNIHYLPEAFNPSAYTEDQRRIPELMAVDVCVYGNLHPWRVVQLSEITDFCSVVTYGVRAPAWCEVDYSKIGYTGRVITLDDKASVLQKARLVFNAMNLFEITSVSNRIFECGGLGAPQILDKNDDFLSLFGGNFNEMLYSSSEEMRAKVKYFLRCEIEREEMASEFRKMILSEHVFSKRLEVINTVQ